MGTFYALGVIKSFNAKSTNVLSVDEWNKLLNEKIDTDLFDIITEGNHIRGRIKNNIFSDNIDDFYKKLKSITHEKDIDYFFLEYGTEIENYQDEDGIMYIHDSEGSSIALHIVFVSLFIEGKVLVEEFNIEPMLINWLFRHTDFGNRLAGCIVSDIVN